MACDFYGRQHRFEAFLFGLMEINFTGGASVSLKVDGGLMVAGIWPRKRRPAKVSSLRRFSGGWLCSALESEEASGLRRVSEW